MKRQTTLILGLIATLTLSGCSLFSGPGYTTRTGTSSSLVDYLYPEGEVPPETDGSVPYLSLPLTVGIAYVPAYHSTYDISEATKMTLLEDVRGEFEKLDYVDEIRIIPDTYLRSTKGVTGMQQVARMYDVDVMALVSYDQVAVSEENKASFLYWTIVGAYFIDGNNNEVQTFVDTAVFDVNTAKLLFRAPGADTNQGRSTIIESNRDLRTRGEESFTTAVHTMTDNLSFELVRFEERVQERPDTVQVEWKEGYSGTGIGSYDSWFLAALAAFAIAIRGLSVCTGARALVSGSVNPDRHRL